MRLAYTDDTVDALNAIICKQQDQIDALTKQYKKIQQQLESLMPLLMENPDDEPPPPHY
ncbi:MAG: SlyX protein [Gammaproteobacteria bacterium]|nr:MAG: SlyX protein [Gammaproteobacteria bacterium]